MNDDRKLCLRCTCRKLNGDEPRQGCADCLVLNTTLKDVVYGKGAYRRAARNLK